MEVSSNEEATTSKDRLGEAKNEAAVSKRRAFLILLVAVVAFAVGGSIMYLESSGKM